MDQIDFQIEQPDAFENGSTKENESLAIVFVIVTVEPIEFVATVVMLLLYEVNRHVAAWKLATQKRAFGDFRAEWHIKINSGGLDLQAGLKNLAEGGQKKHGAMSQLHQFAGQAAADIGQSARLAEGNRLGCSKQNIHGYMPALGFNGYAIFHKSVSEAREHWYLALRASRLPFPLSKTSFRGLPRNQVCFRIRLNC